MDLRTRWPALNLSILATDIDADVLRRAKIACYPVSSLKEARPDWLARAFVQDNEDFCLRPELRRLVRFLQWDLCEELPDGSFHLILCRNLAFTYFAEPLQRRITTGLLARLGPGGCLILGAHEHLRLGDGIWLVSPLLNSQIFKRV
ncbi:CheR family methyltransferase [Nitrosospira multiformis]|uniref:CheR family methyltransferase n=1 Tax=Nitrosospira multiformis TaxID=1231 RepID=UPI0015A57FD4|nr:CheR family methyltransferase [Nitrosospira multiformis]